MSTNKTQNYQLHVWEPGDDFLRTEFNENFAKLDQIPEVVAGMYTGDGETARTIELGFRPQAVLVVDNMGAMQSGSTYYGGLALDGFNTTYGAAILIKIVEDGFQLGKSSTSTSADTNKNGKIYYYLATKI